MSVVAAITSPVITAVVLLTCLTYSHRKRTVSWSMLSLIGSTDTRTDASSRLGSEVSSGRVYSIFRDSYTHRSGLTH